MDLNRALEDDERLEEFFIIKDVGTKTRQAYTTHIKYYCESTATNKSSPLTPTELIREALDEWYDHKHVSDQNLKKRLLKFIKYLRTKDSLSKNTKRRVFLNVKAFYAAFEIEFPKTVKMESEPLPELSIDDLPSKNDIKLAFENTPKILYKAILLFLTSTALSGIDVRHFTYQDFLHAIREYYEPSKRDALDIELLSENLEGKEIIPVWEGKRLKKPHIYYMTFNSPETTRYIIKHLQKNPPKSLDTPLFHYKQKIIKEITWSKYFDRVNKRCKFPQITNEGYMCAHNLRRRFETWCIDAGVDFVQAERLMGHVLPKTNRSYIKLLRRESMKNAYLKALPALTVIDDVETRVLTDEKLAELEAENRSYAERLDALERQINLKDEIDKLP